jgi:hypothetical protein
MKNKVMLFEEFVNEDRYIEVDTPEKPRNVGKLINTENDIFDIYERNDTRHGLIYTMVEKNPKFTTPEIYIYSLIKGNLTRGNINLWARQELRSTSQAFHKGKEDKMAIPNNLELAIEIATNHIKSYKRR